MKQMTCAQMGGPATCTAVLTGNTAEEMVKNGTAHITEFHPDLAEQVKKMTLEETTKWMADFQPKFATARDM